MTGKMRRHSCEEPALDLIGGRNPSPYLHPAVRARRWIPAYARMTHECAHSCPLRHSCEEPALDLIGGRNPSPYLHPAVRARRWIPACARMTDECCHSCALPSFLRRACPRPDRGEESIHVSCLTQRIHPTISGHKSRQSGLSFSINAIFQSRFHFFNCFSRVMAPVISVCISK